MKSFLLPVGRIAGTSLTTALSALSCGAAFPVSGLDILHISEEEPDTLLPMLVEDLNRAHSLLSAPGNDVLFPSSFLFDAFRLRFPSSRALAQDPASAGLLDALRGKGMPLSYRTDREAVEWAFSVLLSGRSDLLAPFLAWLQRLSDAHATEDAVRVALLCDLSDPFSAGVCFSVLRYLKETAGLDASSVAFFCLSSETFAGPHADVLASSLSVLESRGLVGKPDGSGDACADAVWLLSLPASMVRTPESFRLLYAVAACLISKFFTREKLPAPGLHTEDMPGILTFQTLGERAGAFAAFLHNASWLISDLVPSLASFLEHPGAIRSISPNTRNGLYRRLFRGKAEGQADALSRLERALRAVLSEILALIRFLPDQLRLAEVSDPLWRQAVEACGRTVTVASEYDVSLKEAEEAGVLNIKPVHRVSLSDTEEEKQVRRLDDIEAQLKQETDRRNALFRSAGGSRAFLALRDCRSRCADALVHAREQLDALRADPGADRLAVAAQSRRILLLDAAVTRCDLDLAQQDLFFSLSGATQEENGTLPPFAGQLLSADAAEKLSVLVSAGKGGTESQRKEMRSMLPGLLYGHQLSDEKALLRRLLSVCLPAEGTDPLAGLVLASLSVSLEETAPLRFLSAGEAPAVPLLPDLYPLEPPLSVSALFPLPSHVNTEADETAAKRGLLAMLLLRQYRRRSADEASLSAEHYRKDDSPLLDAWLSSTRNDDVWIFSLCSDGASLPFALVLPGADLVPARLTPAHASLVPVYASPWFDTENLSFRDPCTLLSEGDRTLLLDRLESMAGVLTGERSASLRAFLSAFRGDLENSATSPSLPECLDLRLKAAFGLRMLPAFAGSLVRVSCRYEHMLPSDRVAASLLGDDAFPASACAVPDDIVFLYRNVPFARESSKTLLEAIPLPAEDWILNLLQQESRILFRSSDDYHDALVRELSLLLERCPDAVPEARSIALALLEEAGQPVRESETELAWPWDPQSPSVLTILTESLGEALAPQAVSPFSDVLTLFPARGNDVIGDSLIGSMCTVSQPAQPDQPEDAPEVMPDAVLPPLSSGFCRALSTLPEGRTLIRPGLLSFDRPDRAGVSVTLTLEGRFPVRLVRTYTGDEILNLYSHDIPTLAVWPDLPFKPEDWHAYYIFAGLPSGMQFTYCASEGDTYSSGDSGETRFVSRSSAFPLCFSFVKDGRCIGSLPNILPSPQLPEGGDVTACMDFGSVGTSVVFASGRHRRPLQGSTLVRTLINNPSVTRDLLRKEFLPAVPVSALLPTAVRIFRNVPGQAPLPFEDGVVLMSSDLQDGLSIPSDALYTCLKWEEDKGRSVSLCLHQIMLMTALQARSDGASSLAWRFALPDEMAKAGREKLAELFTALALQVNEESGFGNPEKGPLITFAAESAALGAYFRLCAPEDTRGGFMVLDLGACTADISLFLRGREHAVRTCQIPLGVHYILLPVLLRDPQLLRRELGHLQDASLQQDIMLLEKILLNARQVPSALRHARLSLDHFLADRYCALLPHLLQNALNGMPTYTGSVLMLYFSYLMMLSGLVLMQIAADPGKNDFLPEQMSLCLSGRGSILLEALPDPYKTGLWRFLTMFRNRRVSSLSLLFSSEKKIEIPVGLSLLQEVSTDLPAASAVPAAISVRPEELLPQFLLCFAREFPGSAQVLFPGFYTNDFYHPFTPYGDEMITNAMSQSFTEQTANRPYDALAAWIGALMEMLPEHPGN